MTDEMMSLRTLLEKSSDADLLLEMVAFAAQRLMELEVESLTGAAHWERSLVPRRDRGEHAVSLETAKSLKNSKPSASNAPRPSLGAEEEKQEPPVCPQNGVGRSTEQQR